MPAAGPALLVWDRSAPAVAPVTRDSYAVRLVVARKLYDAGRVVAQGPSIVDLAPGPLLELNPSDLEHLGVIDGGTVRASSSRGSGVFTTRSTRGVPAGTARLAHNQPGDDSDLVDIAEAVTDLRLETVVASATVGLSKGGAR